MRISTPVRSTCRRSSGGRTVSGAYTLIKDHLAGGTQPEWRHDGKELFFMSADRKLMAVPVGIHGVTFSAGVPHALFDVEIPEVSAPYPTEYAVTTNGQRFLVNTVVEQASRPTLTVVLNWAAEIAK